RASRCSPSPSGKSNSRRMASTFRLVLRERHEPLHARSPEVDVHVELDAHDLPAMQLLRQHPVFRRSPTGELKDLATGHLRNLDHKSFPVDANPITTCWRAPLPRSSSRLDINLFDELL